MSADIWTLVRFEVEGYHCWPEAPEHRAYLRARHFHRFPIVVRVQVHHDEREIEFHDLVAFARAQTPVGELGTQSCETLARTLGERLCQRYPGRAIEVEWWEDGHVGARLCWNTRNRGHEEENHVSDYQRIRL